MKPAPHVRSNTSNDGLILLDIATGQIFSANLIAARIWNGLEQGLLLSEIIEEIAADTGADPVVVERDATEFVNTLSLRALVEEF